MGGCNTWEELILGAAVLRHGEHDWNVVASELRARTRYPTLFTPKVCKTKYKDLQKRYAGSRIWFEELRKQCVTDLKRELARSEASIGFLESKIKSLEAEKQYPNKADYAWSETESPLPTSNSDGTESSSKKISTGEQSAGSYTENTRMKTSWLCEHHHQEMEIDTKPRVSVSSEHNKDLTIERRAEAGYGGVITRKRRGQRKRKDCNQAVKEGSVGDSDNAGSSNVVSPSRKEASTSDYDQIRESAMKNHNGSSYTVKRNNLMEIFQSIAQIHKFLHFTISDCLNIDMCRECQTHVRQGWFWAAQDDEVQKFTPDGKAGKKKKKRARYRKIIRQHVDVGMIRSRIIGHSIKSAKELFRDLLLLVSNALVFYSSRTQEYKSALSLRHLIMKENKRHCRGSCNEATSSAFLLFDAPVKPRSARCYHHPRPPPCKDKVSEKLSNVDIIVPVNMPMALEKTCDSEYNVSLHSLLKVKKGLKRLRKVEPESANTQAKSSPVKQRKRISK